MSGTNHRDWRRRLRVVHGESKRSRPELGWLFLPVVFALVALALLFASLLLTVR